MQLTTDFDVKDGLNGAMSIRFKPGSPVNEFCAKQIPGYNPSRYEILAIRVYYGKELIVTFFAIDKEHMGHEPYDEGKIPVKKFKMNNLHIKDFLPFIDECNFTVSTGEYQLEDMEVINR